MSLQNLKNRPVERVRVYSPTRKFVGFKYFLLTINWVRVEEIFAPVLGTISVESIEIL